MHHVYTYVYHAPVGVKIPVKVHSITVWVCGGRQVLSPEPILGIVNPSNLIVGIESHRYVVFGTWYSFSVHLLSNVWLTW